MVDPAKTAPAVRRCPYRDSLALAEALTTPLVLALRAMRFAGREDGLRQR